MIFLLINLMSKLKPLKYYINKFKSDLSISSITNMYTYIINYKNTIAININYEDFIDYENLNVNCNNCVNCICCIN